MKARVRHKPGVVGHHTQVTRQKRYRPEEIIAKLRETEVLLGDGKKVPEVVKVLGGPLISGRSLTGDLPARREAQRHV